jgi:hypothetical protein
LRGKFGIIGLLVISTLICLLLIALGCPALDSFVWIFTLSTVFIFLRNIGQKVNYLDVTAMAACVSYLLMPLLSYNIFGKHNGLAALWHTFMTIDKEEYFSFALPGTVSLVVGLWFPSLIKVPYDDKKLMENVKESLSRRKGVGYVLILIGILAVPLVEWAPLSVKAIFYFISQLTYLGALYLLFSGLQFKRITIVVIVLLMIFQSVLTGMYGELFYWSIMGAILLLINKKSFGMLLRVGLLSLGVVFVFFIQSIKHEYRDAVWNGAERGNDPALFASLIIDRVKDPGSIFAPERIYKVVVRGNQGYLVGRAMKYVPKFEPFANGETIFESCIAAFVPRFLWPDKPRVGGHENICRFLGDCGRHNYSYNIGQLGEAYVNFGRAGGIVYMFCYGLLLNLLLNIFRFLSVRNSTLLLWTPLLFFPALIVETDLLTFINTFVKGAMFCAFCYFALRVLFKIRL